MKSTRVSKEKLLEILKTNRSKHIADAAEALKGYHEEVVSRLEKALEAAKEGTKFETNLNLIAPQDQTKEYDRVVMMTEMSIDDVIELSSSEFQMYVMDQWSWSDTVKLINSSYIKSSIR